MKMFKLYNVLLENKNYGFFSNKSGIPDFDAILFGNQELIPKKYHNWNAEIEWMSPEEYLKECAKLQNTTYKEQFRYILSSNVKQIMDKIDRVMRDGYVEEEKIKRQL